MERRNAKQAWSCLFHSFSTSCSTKKEQPMLQTQQSLRTFFAQAVLLSDLSRPVPVCLTICADLREPVMVARLRGSDLERFVEIQPSRVRNSQYMQKAVLSAGSSCTCVQKRLAQIASDRMSHLESEVSCAPGPQSAMTLASSSSSNATVIGFSPGSMARSVPKSFDSSSPLFFDLQHILNIPVQI